MTNANNFNKGCPLVSVIVPVYNTARYLRDCLDSLLNQTMCDYEIILVNDGSADESGLICDEYAGEYPCVKVIHQQNGGPSAARNAGLDSARGEHIAFVDSDDRISPDFLKRLYIQTTSADCQIVICGLRNIYVTGSQIETNRIFYHNHLICSKEPPFFIVEATGLFNPVCNKLYRSSIIQDNGLRFDDVFAEDFKFNISYFYFVKNIILVNEPLYFYYHRNTETLTTKYCKGMYDKVLECNRMRTDLFLLFDEQNRMDHIELLSDLCSDYLWICIANLFRKDSPEQFFSRYGIMKKMMKNEASRTYIERFVPKSALHILFKCLYSIKSPLFMNCIYTALFFLRNQFSGVYVSVRNRLLERNQG